MCFFNITFSYSELYAYRRWHFCFGKSAHCVCRSKHEQRSWSVGSRAGCPRSNHLRLTLAHRKPPVCSGIPQRASSRRPGANSRVSNMDVVNAKNAGAFFGPALKHRALAPPLVVARLGSRPPWMAEVREMQEHFPASWRVMHEYAPLR
jgi:hypothetical protein